MLEGEPACAPDRDTTYAAGEGLTLAGATFSSVLGAIVSGGEIEDGTVGLADLAFDPATQSELEALSRGRPGFSRTVVDGAGMVGTFPSATIGVDGLGLISYFDIALREVKVAHCLNIACTSSTTARLTTSSPLSSIAIGPDGMGLVAFSASFGDQPVLKVAQCLDLACVSATMATPVVGLHAGPSLAIGSDGLGLIAALNGTGLDPDLAVTHCADPACTSATPTVVDTEFESSAGFPSLAVGSDGLGLIAYPGPTGLRVAHCSDLACGNATIEVLGGRGRALSVAIGRDGLALIGYTDGQGGLSVAHCNDLTCSSATHTTLDARMFSPMTSLAIGRDGLGLVTYHDSLKRELKVAHCANVACTGGTVATLDSGANIGAESSVTIGVDGLGLVAYSDKTNHDLKVAHLSNVFGVPFVRAR